MDEPVSQKRASELDIEQEQNGANDDAVDDINCQVPASVIDNLLKREHIEDTDDASISNIESRVSTNPILKDLVHINVRPIARSTRSHSPHGVVVIHVARHGGYDVHINNDKKLDVAAVACPVSNLIRYQYAAMGTCSWSSNQLSYKDMLMFWYNLSNTISQYHHTDPDKIKKIIGVLETEQFRLSNDPHINADHYDSMNIKMQLGEKKLCNYLQHSNKITHIEMGQLYLDKGYQIDLKQMVSGIIIFYRTTFRLHDLFFNEDGTEIPELIHLQNSSLPDYNIGAYDSITKFITYEPMSELLACPFFMLYIKLHKLGADLTATRFDYTDPPYDPSTSGLIYKLFDGISFDNNLTKALFNKTKPTGWDNEDVRNMVGEVNTDIVYSYFKNVDTVVNIDLSCAAFVHKPIAYRRKKRKQIVMFPATVRSRYKNIFGGKRRKHTRKRKHKYKHKKTKYSKMKKRNNKFRTNKRKVRGR